MALQRGFTSDRKVIRSIWSVDGMHLLEVFLRSDGHYGFVGHSQLIDDAYTFWTPTEFSEIYDTADSAEREALLSIPWLVGLASH